MEEKHIIKEKETNLTAIVRERDPDQLAQLAINNELSRKQDDMHARVSAATIAFGLVRDDRTWLDGRSAKEKEAKVVWAEEVLPLAEDIYSWVKNDNME